MVRRAAGHLRRAPRAAGWSCPSLGWKPEHDGSASTTGREVRHFWHPSEADTEGRLLTPERFRETGERLDEIAGRKIPRTIRLDVTATLRRRLTACIDSPRRAACKRPARSSEGQRPSLISTTRPVASSTLRQAFTRREQSTISSFARWRLTGHTSKGATIRRKSPERVSRSLSSIAQEWRARARRARKVRSRPDAFQRMSSCTRTIGRRRGPDEDGVSVSNWIRNVVDRAIAARSTHETSPAVQEPTALSLDGATPTTTTTTTTRVLIRG